MKFSCAPASLAISTRPSDKLTAATARLPPSAAIPVILFTLCKAF
nr:MAG TPA: hypothetical protein [Crassvirales sp.]